MTLNQELLEAINRGDLRTVQKHLEEYRQELLMEAAAAELDGVETEEDE